MKVRCIRADTWVTTGKEYTVLGIHGRGGSFRYQLVGDHSESPAFHDSNSFELTSFIIPKNWIFRVYPSFEWEMTPLAWSGKDFWVAYFDGDASAAAIFTQTALMLQTQES